MPEAAQATLLAAFNSGYKLKDTPGGALIEGRRTRQMIDGLATLAIRADGTATVGEWGRDLLPNDGYVALRQNLRLVVAGGAAVDGLSSNSDGRWGTVRNALPTWRSGIGVTGAATWSTCRGTTSPSTSWPAALIQAGSIRAMELDIHRGMVAFNLFSHDPRLHGHKLQPDMEGSPNRYLTTDWRDFVVVTAR